MGWNSPQSNEHLLSTFLYQTVSHLIFRAEEAREMNAPIFRDKERAQSLSVHLGVGLGFDCKSTWLQSWYSWLSLWKHVRFHAHCLYVYPTFRKDCFFADRDVKVCLLAGYSNLDAGWSSNIIYSLCSLPFYSEIKKDSAMGLFIQTHTWGLPGALAPPYQPGKSW